MPRAAEGFAGGVEVQGEEGKGFEVHLGGGTREWVRGWVVSWLMFIRPEGASPAYALGEVVSLWDMSADSGAEM